MAQTFVKKEEVLEYSVDSKKFILKWQPSLK